MGGAVMSRMIVVGAGLLYPAYCSYKAVKAANLRQYVRWIMYWVVFAIFTAIETFTDVFLSWLPFYYEMKVLFVLWLMLPYTKGASYIYRKLIHPNLSKREQEIDLFLENARERSYRTVVEVGSKGINLAANAVVTAAVKGQAVVSDRLKSYSVADLTSIPEDSEIHHRQQPAPFMNPSVIRERHLTSGAPMVTFDPVTQTDGTSQLTSQYKAYSMMNLTQPYSENPMQGGSMPPVADDEPFDTEPLDYTIDDMLITRRSNYAEEAVPPTDDYTTQFFTMPRPKKGTKSKTKQMPPLPTTANEANVRRSKRKQKPKTRAGQEETSD